MNTPFALVVIKPMSVGRGNAPDILASILANCPVALREFRVWVICRTTLTALTDSNNRSVFPPGNQNPSWVCLFTHIDRATNPTQLLGDYFGSMVPASVKPGTLRYQYSGYNTIGPTAHPADDVVHLSHESRADLEAKLLFKDFDAQRV